ncbi:MAG: protein kinase [Rhabdochlamydiaceae bacterium]|nr:protein kinase [Rhabdochlamydiaceae bacterium]
MIYIDNSKTQQKHKLNYVTGSGSSYDEEISANNPSTSVRSAATKIPVLPRDHRHPIKAKQLARAITNATPIFPEDAETIANEVVKVVQWSKLPGNRRLCIEGEIKFKRDDHNLNFSYVISGSTVYVHLKENEIRGGFKIVCDALMIHLPSNQVQEIVHKKIRPHKTIHNVDCCAIAKAEAEAQARLRHPSIPKVHEVCTYTKNFQPRTSIYEKKCEETGEKLLQKNLLSFNQKTTFFYDIARAVAHLHRQGLCHNDLKLNNTMIAEGKGQLIDYGVMTKEGEIPLLSHQEIMAPERKASPAIPVSSETDVFQFGLMLALAFAPADTGMSNLIGKEDIIRGHFALDIKCALSKWIPSNASDNELKTLIDRCSSDHPEARPPMVEIASILAKF